MQGKQDLQFIEMLTKYFTYCRTVMKMLDVINKKFFYFNKLVTVV